MVTVLRPTAGAAASGTVAVGRTDMAGLATRDASGTSGPSRSTGVIFCFRQSTSLSSGGTGGTGGTRRRNDGSGWNREGEQGEPVSFQGWAQFPLFHPPVPLRREILLGVPPVPPVPPAEERFASGTMNSKIGGHIGLRRRPKQIAR